MLTLTAMHAAALPPIMTSKLPEYGLTTIARRVLVLSDSDAARFLGHCPKAPVSVEAMTSEISPLSVDVLIVHVKEIFLDRR